MMDVKKFSVALDARMNKTDWMQKS